MANEVVEIDGDGVILTGDVATEHTSMVMGLAKAEIDQQIATAHKFPRNIVAVVNDVTSLATLSPSAAAEMNYALPRGGKSITGPSIRMAELIVSQWGNCRVGARVVHVDRVEKYLEAEGIFHDLQSNAATTARVRRKISDRDGRLFNDDMITMAGNAACSIAKRNAVLAGIPKAAWMPGYEAALKVIKGDAKTLTERREGALKALAAFGVTPDMIYGALELNGLEEITLEHMPTLIGWHTVLKSEEQTVEQLFPRPGGDDESGGKKKVKATGMTNKLKDAVKSEEKPPEDKKPEPEKDDGKGDEKPAESPPEGKGDDKPEPEGEGQSETAPLPADEEAILEARERGEVAHAKGRSRKSPPASIKDDPALVKAFEEGFDEAKAASAT